MIALDNHTGYFFVKLSCYARCLLRLLVITVFDNDTIHKCTETA